MVLERSKLSFNCNEMFNVVIYGVLLHFGGVVYYGEKNCTMTFSNSLILQNFQMCLVSGIMSIVIF